MAEIRKRQVAHKIRIGDALNGKPVLDGERLSFVEVRNKKVFRVNIVANVIDKFESEGDKKYISFTLDDASGQIRLKVFGDDVDRFKNIIQGNTIVVIGVLRLYNNELYINPEIIKAQDPRYLLVRKLELEKLIKPVVSEDKSEVVNTRDKIVENIKSSEPEGIEVEKLVMELNSKPEIINSEIQKLLEEGVVYEPRPGILRYLG